MNTKPDIHQIAYERAVQKAEDEIPLLEKFIESPGWTWFVKRLEAEAAPLVDRLLTDDNMTDAETRTVRRIIRTLKEVSQLPAADLARHRTYLEQQRKMGGHYQ